MIFAVCEVSVFLLLPLLTKKKRTIGMSALNIYLIDKKGQPVKTSKALLHNLLVVIWLHAIFEIQGRLTGEAFVMIILQLFLFIWFGLLIIKSLSQRTVCCFWEPWLDTYLKAYIPK